jgi:hypothetical protein
MAQIDPSLRITATSALNHYFFKDSLSDEILSPDFDDISEFSKSDNLIKILEAKKPRPSFQSRMSEELNKTYSTNGTKTSH